MDVLPGLQSGGWFGQGYGRTTRLLWGRVP